MDDEQKRGGGVDVKAGARGGGGGGVGEAPSVEKARSSSQGKRLCIALELDGLNGFETLVPQ